MTTADESRAETRILIADDHDSFRSGLRAVLGTADDLVVVGEAASGSEAVSQVAALHPDVVLMDLAMPGMDGIEATRRIVDAAPHVAVLVLTMSDDDDSVFAAIQAGARGYLLKGAQRAELVRSVRAVAAGDAIFGPAVARRLMAYFSTAHAERLARPRSPSSRTGSVRSSSWSRRGDRTPRSPRTGALAEDRAQPRLEHLLEAPGPRPRRGNRPGPRGRPGRRKSAAEGTPVWSHPRDSIGTRNGTAVP